MEKSDYPKFILIVLIVLLFSGIGITQEVASSDLQERIDFGLKYLSDQNFDRAESEFNAGLTIAKITPAEQKKIKNLLLQLEQERSVFVREKGSNYDRTLERIRDLKNQEVLITSGLADGASNAFEAQRNRYAMENGRSAFAYRLSALAELERNQGRLKHALQLAYLSLVYADADNEPQALKSFNRVVRDSFTVRLPLSTAPSAISYSAGYVLCHLADSLVSINVETLSRNLLADGIAEEVSFLSQSKQNTVFVTGNKLMSYATGWKEPRELQGHKTEIKCVASSDNDRLYSSGRDGNIHYWSSDHLLLETFTSDSKNSIYQLSAREEGLWSRSSDRTVSLWKNGIKINKIKDPAGGYLYEFTMLSESLLVPTSTGNILKINRLSKSVDVLNHGLDPVVKVLGIGQRHFLSQSIDNKIIIWSIDGSKIKELSLSDTAMGTVVGKDGKEIIAWTEEGTLYVWSDEGELLQEMRLPIKNIRKIVVVPSEQFLFIVSKQGHNYLLDRVSGTVVNEWSGAAQVRLSPWVTEDDQRMIDFDIVGRTLRVSPLPWLVFQKLRDQEETELEITSDFINRFDLTFGLKNFTRTR